MRKYDRFAMPAIVISPEPSRRLDAPLVSESPKNHVELAVPLIPPSNHPERTVKPLGIHPSTITSPTAGE
jgi:hypothetical protein